MRRSAFRWLACVLALGGAPALASAQSMTVVLLGTGSPEPAVDRFGPATLVDAGGQRIVFDAGRGVTQRLWQIPVSIGDITQIFLTHLHSDHVVGLSDMWLMGWLQTAFGRRRAPLHVFGPAGTAAMVKSIREAHAADVRSRTPAGMVDSTVAIEGHDVAEGVVYERGGVRITAFDVDHSNLPSLGYRLQFDTRSVVISGDTRPSENLTRFAQGTDVLIHEVIAATPEAQAVPLLNRILASHTSPEQAGAVFARVQPRLAVYTHVSLLAAPERRPALLEAILPRTRTAYGGRVMMGEDLMHIQIGDTIEVRYRPKEKR